MSAGNPVDPSAWSPRISDRQDRPQVITAAVDPVRLLLDGGWHPADLDALGPRSRNRVLPRNGTRPSAPPVFSCACPR